jgi:hypothetical protein
MTTFKLFFIISIIFVFGCENEENEQDQYLPSETRTGEQSMDDLRRQVENCKNQSYEAFNDACIFNAISVTCHEKFIHNDVADELGYSANAFVGKYIDKDINICSEYYNMTNGREIDCYSMHDYNAKYNEQSDECKSFAIGLQNELKHDDFRTICSSWLSGIYNCNFDQKKEMIEAVDECEGDIDYHKCAFNTIGFECSGKEAVYYESTEKCLNNIHDAYSGLRDQFIKAGSYCDQFIEYSKENCGYDEYYYYNYIKS